MTHRVIYKHSSYIIVKGDHNPISDGRIYPRQIAAQAIQVKRSNRITSLDNIYLIQSTIYFQEIVTIKKAFEKVKIDFVFLKGLPLHLYFEGSHPRRIYADCDVIINKKYFAQAESILIEKGYKKADIHWSKTVRKMQKRDVEVMYTKIVNGFLVTFDIHLQIDLSIVHLGNFEALYPQKLIDCLTTECLHTKKQIRVNGEQFLILDSEFLILYLALHLFHHNFSGVFRYEFLDKVIRHSGKRTKRAHPESILDNQKWCQNDDIFLDVASKIKEYRLQNFVYPVFVLLKKYYKTPIPQKFFRSIEPVNPLTHKFINQIIKTNIFNDEPRIKAGITRFKYLFYLSPYPWWRKAWVFVNPQVTYTIFWVITRRIKNLFLRFY